ncbi:MAG: Spy/CpxP family protein refolding chaperone [Leptolyngbyaceae cyanobacterium RU_5_1]|nr:Spy/CpxP family protein refolding chaperone [Leptolyngbyaceae cyanobacterium RU_5_1]
MSRRPVSIISVLVLMLGSATVFTHSSAIAVPGFPLAQALAQPVIKQRIAQSQGRPGSSVKSGWLKNLNLSRDQLQKIREIRQQYKDKLAQQQQAIRQAKQELHTLMAGNASADQIRQKFNQVKALRQQLADTRLESMLAIRNLLNPEQRQKLAEYMRQYAGKSRGRLTERMEEF